MHSERNYSFQKSRSENIFEGDSWLRQLSSLNYKATSDALMVDLIYIRIILDSLRTTLRIPTLIFLVSVKGDTKFIVINSDMDLGDGIGCNNVNGL